MIGESESRRRWSWPHLSPQILRTVRGRLRQEALWYSRIGEVQGKRSVEFSSVAKRCSSGWEYEEARSDRRRPGTSDCPEDSKSRRRLVASGNSDTKGKVKIWPHNFHVSADSVPHMENVGQRYGLSPRDKMESLDVNAVVWSVTLQAAVHLGTDCAEKLGSTRNQSSKSLRQLFQVTRKLIIDQTEITGFLWLVGSSSCGERRPCWLTMLFSLQQQNLRLSAMSERHQSRTSQSQGMQD